MDLRGSPVFLLYVSAHLMLDASCDIRATSGRPLVGKEPGTEVHVTMRLISATRVCQRLHHNMLQTVFAGVRGSVMRENGSAVAPTLHAESIWSPSLARLHWQH